MSLDLANPGRTIRVGVILMGGVTEVLDVGPVDFPPAMKAQALDTEFHWVSEAGKTRTSRLTSNMSLFATDSLASCPPLDIVLMGASFGPDMTPAELAFIRKSYQECSAFLTVCGGVEAPLWAGILEGKTATAPRFLLTELRGRAKGTQWVERRWARDGKLWTSGTLLNGLDLMSAFIRATWPSGEGLLVDRSMKACAWPNREPEYKDVAWEY